MEDGQRNFIVYACAGCSKGGQAAYKISITMDERNVAEMSCLAGIASGSRSFFRKVRNRRVVAIEGCPIECTKSVLTNQGLTIHRTFQLKRYGIKKNIASSADQIESVVEKIARELSEGQQQSPLI